MPKPRPNETQKHFIARCIPQVMDEGIRGKKPSQKQAVAVCHSMWRSRKKSHFMLSKQQDGTYTWCALWTNKFRDEDNPPEILAEVAHREFAKAVGKATYPKPELWLWHNPGTKFGQTEIVAYDLDTGFSLAAGTIDKGMEPIAEALNSLSDVAVSHGMPREEIQRDPEDSSVIVRYRTKEISPLPQYAAANKLTGFVVLEEKDMELEPKGSEEDFRTWFGEKFDEIKGLIKLKSKEATGLEFKDVEEEAPAKELEKVEDTPVEPVDEPAEEADETAAKESETQPITREEVAEAIVSGVSEALDPVVTQVAEVAQKLAAEIVTLKEQLSELQKSDEEKITEKAQWTPAASIAEMVRGTIVGKEEARVDGRTKEARDGPQQAKESKVNIHVPSSPRFGNTLSNIVSGDWKDGIKE